jgi:SNF2 family DNA or RNA helicase
MYPVKGTPKDHQLRALMEADLRTGHAFWMDPGAGKTFTCIAEAGTLFMSDHIDGMIIVAPKDPHAQWVEEQFPQWADFPYVAIHNKQPSSAIKKFLARASRGHLGVLAINYDALRTNSGEELLDQFRAIYPRYYLVVDESQKIKNPTAQRTKETLRLALRATYRRMLSGTPILKGLEDLWSQYEAAVPGLAWPHQPVALNKGGKGVNTYGYIGYRNHYCKLAPVPGNPRAQRIVGYRNEEELRDRVRPFTTRILADEFMKGEVPDIIPVRTSMSDAQKVQYRLMKDHLLAQIASGTVTAQNALVQLGKLQQIASGFLIDEDGTTHELGSNKLDAAMDLIEQMDEPVIVWAPFIHLQQMMVRRLAEAGYGDRIYTRDEVEAWKLDRNGILVGNQTSGLGVGLNLQHAAANIYLTNSFSSEARWQSIKRTDRIGQTRQVRVWDLIAPDTVDEKVMKALDDKQDISRRNIDQLREMA